MKTHPYPLLAYDATGNVIQTLDYMGVKGPDGKVIGLVDFAAIEEAGGEMLDVWRSAGEVVDLPTGTVTPWEAAGSKVWPEWIDRPTEFRVELVGPPGRKRIAALVHKTSGYRRDRATIEAKIQKRIDDAKKKPRRPDGSLEPADIRDLVGGPDRPLRLDDQGRSLTWRSIEKERAAIPKLPMLPTNTEGSTDGDEAARSATAGDGVPLPDLDRHDEGAAADAEPGRISTRSHP